MSSSGDSTTVNLDDNSRISSKLTKQKPIKKPKKINLTKHQFRSTKYFTSGHGIDNKTARNLLNEPSPYHVDFEEFSRKTTQKSSKKNDLFKRLYVEEPYAANYQTIIDVAPDFYETTQGRPVGRRHSLRQYIGTIRDVLRAKVIAGYRQDDLMQIEENLIAEQKVIDETRRNFKLYSNTFDQFLYNDHMRSMDLLKKSEDEMNACQAKYEEYRQLSTDYGALRSIIYKTEEKWRDSKLYQRFLYLLSPMEWREQYDPNLDIKSDLRQVSKVFGKYRLSSERTSLSDLLNIFIEDTASSASSEPKLYFTDPKELVDVFKFIEIQNLNTLLKAEELAEPLENLQNGMNLAEDLFHTEMASLQDILENVSKEIAWEERRAKYLQQLATTLINGQFKDLLISDDILNLQVLIEDVYEKLIGPNDANLTVVQMMEELEMKFHEALLHFDQLPMDMVMKIERKYYKTEMILMRKAEEAARKLLQFDQLFDKLMKATLPSAKHKPTRPLVWRSRPVNPPIPKPPPPRPLTDGETHYLDFFTNYCKRDHNLIDYGIDLRAEPKTWLQLVGIEENEGEAEEDNEDENEEVID